MSLFERGKKGLSPAMLKRYDNSSTAAFYKKLDKKIKEVETLMEEGKNKRKEFLYRFSKKKGGRVKKKRK